MIKGNVFKTRKSDTYMKKVYTVLVVAAITTVVITSYWGPWNTKSQKSEIYKETDNHVYKGKSIHEERFFLKNPLTGNLQRVHMAYTSRDVPALILVPGGGKSSRDFVDTALNGASDFVVFTFDPLGRGESQGVENMHGREDQAFLHEVYVYAVENSNGSISIASFSFGIAMVAGALAEYDMPIDVWVDWEGPHDRTFVAHLCLENREDMNGLSVKEKKRIRREMLQRISQGNAPEGCSDNEYWAEREAILNVKGIEKGEVKLYHRLQGKNDHVHGNFYEHALEMVNTMTGQGITTRLNDAPENVVYTEKMLLEVLFGPFDSRSKALEIIREYYTQ